MHVFIARQFVEAGNHKVGFEKPIAGARSFKLIVGKNLEGQMKAAIELVLPLFGKTAGTNNKAALQISASNQFFDQQPGHDCFAGARIIGEQKAKRLARQH